jgi:hypothetical protein
LARPSAATKRFHGSRGGQNKAILFPALPDIKRQSPQLLDTKRVRDYRWGQHKFCAARTSIDEKVHLERFGSGAMIYFTVMSEQAGQRECTLEMDLKPLGLEPGRLSVEEVARNASVNLQGSHEGSTSRVRLTLAPNQTNILKLSSAR